MRVSCALLSVFLLSLHTSAASDVLIGSAVGNVGHEKLNKNTDLSSNLSVRKLHVEDASDRSPNKDISDQDVLLTIDSGSVVVAADLQNAKIYTGPADTLNLIEIPLENILKPVAVAYDYVDEMVYWTDVDGQSISRANLDGTSQQLLVSNLSVPDGLTVDSKARIMYWTDTGYDRIEKANIDGSDRTVIIETNLDEPRGIAVDNTRGHIYWTDWGTSKIEKANIDGSNRITLVSSAIHWPNGLVLDLPENRLYFCDASLDKIEFIDLDGGEASRVQLFSYPGGIHPFDLAIHGDDIYWSDWSYKRLIRMNKHTPSQSAYLVGPTIFNWAGGLEISDSFYGTGPTRPAITTDIPVSAATTLSDIAVPVRLVGGGAQSEGRVEVYFSNTWGTICDDLWDDLDADVICRQLGYPQGNHRALHRAHFGEGLGPIWMDNVNCNGLEENIGYCDHAGWANHNCGHYEDASVVCEEGTSDSTTEDGTTLVDITTGSETTVEGITSVLGSCKDFCGRNAGPCWCDNYCVIAGDCCPDFYVFCGVNMTTEKTLTSTTEGIHITTATSTPRTQRTTQIPITHATDPGEGSPSAELVCSDNTLTAYIARSVIGDVTGDHLHFNDESCVGTNHNSSHVRISTLFNQCGTVMEVRDDFVVFSNVVRDEALPVTPGNVISRDRDILIPVECHMERDGLGSISFHADTSKIIFREDGYGEFSFQLQLYPDNRYATPYPPGAYPIDVNLRDMLYFEAGVSAEPGLELFVETCVATTTTNPYSSLQYSFLEEGCAKDNTLQFFSSSDPMLQRFGLEAFAFVGYHTPVYVHCFLMLCNISDPTSRCALGCQPALQKRDLSVRAATPGSKSYVMTQGPLKLSQDSKASISVAAAEDSNSHFGRWSVLTGSIAFMALCLTATVLAVVKSRHTTSPGYMVVATQEME